MNSNEYVMNSNPEVSPKELKIHTEDKFFLLSKQFYVLHVTREAWSSECVFQNASRKNGQEMKARGKATLEYRIRSYTKKDRLVFCKTESTDYMSFRAVLHKGCRDVLSSLSNRSYNIWI